MAEPVPTLVMGVVNVTPDSFSDGGAFLHPQAAITEARGMLEEGAAIVDNRAASAVKRARLKRWDMQRPSGSGEERAEGRRVFGTGGRSSP